MNSVAVIFLSGLLVIDHSVIHAFGSLEINSLVSDGETYGIPKPNPLKMNKRPMMITNIGIAF